MLRLLAPVDGSEVSKRAIDQLLKGLGGYKEPAEIHLLNVQHPLHADVSMFVGSDQIRQFHHDEGMKALRPARERLDAAAVPYAFHIGIGDPAVVISQYAKEKACDQIILGTRGLGAVAGILLGSVATKVIHLSDVPVLLVK